MNLSSASEIRRRLMNPPNAVYDPGIDLKRKFATPVIPVVVTAPMPTVIIEKVPEPDALDGDEPFILSRIKVNDIIKFVAREFKIKISDLLSDRRTLNLVHPRQIIMWLSKEITPRSMPYIGQRMNGRDHTTVLHGYHRIEMKRRIDPELQAQLDQFIVALRSFKPRNSDNFEISPRT